VRRVPVLRQPDGRFVIGGPDGDCGLTGRKIIVVPMWRGPAWRRRLLGQGPDQGRPLRRLCRALPGQERGRRRPGRSLHHSAVLCHRVSKPLSVYIDTHGTGKVDEARLSDVLQQLVDLSPRGIRQHLGLNKPIYARTSAHGHFGRTPDADGGFSWEKTDLADSLKSALA